MRPNRFVLVLAALAATAAAGTLARPAASACTPVSCTIVIGQSQQATLRFVSLAPVVVRGFSFKPYEQVRLSGLINRTELSTIVRANFLGSFTVKLGGDLKLSGCSGGALIRAVGSLGSTAILRLPPRLCPVVTP